MSARVLVFILKLAAALIAISIPLLGAWLGSSLAAMLDGPKWVAPAVALLGFPVLPVAWEAWAQFRAKRRAERRKEEPRKAILTRWDRLILRTLSLNVLFLGAFVAFDPSLTFTALSTRGDWMLDGAEGETASTVRQGLFATVESLEWLLIGSEADNVYRELVDDDAPPPDLSESARPSNPQRHDDQSPNPSTVEDPPTTPVPHRPTPDTPTDSSPNSPAPDHDAPDQEAPEERSRRQWPFSQQPHPIAANVPASATGSIAALAQHFRTQVADPLERTQAIHDWIALHVSYDVALLRELEAGGRPSFSSQEAAAVLTARTAVCAGYSNLMKALGEAADLEVRVVTGHTKQSAELGGIGHAWNAVKLGEQWHLMDVTWDAGFVNDDEFTARFTSDYFLTPPDIFGTRHFPDEPQWQLLEAPLTRAEFLRLPNMRPAFFRHGLTLEQPTRSQTSTRGVTHFRLKNPSQRFVMVRFGPKGGDPSTECGLSNQRELDFTCRFPSAGIYEVHIFVNQERAGSYAGVGAVEVVRQ